MFKAKIICLGKFKEPGFVQLEQEYLKRLRPYCKIEVEELKEVPYKTSRDAEVAKRNEAELILKRISKDAVMILLDEKGTLRGSVEFAGYIERICSIGRELVFVIGSGAGTDVSVKERANHTISLSSLTFTHNFARVLLEEQLYRACTIMHGKEYHKV